ncbi:MAG TPA: M56 family metallopeptidase [Pirellulales bacterium]|nr:M56 family metallopeptidase [Pirellulales bacterium]
MNALTVAALVGALLRTTLALAASYLAATGLLRWRRSSSPFLHRAACVLALAQGWWFVRFAVDVPWYEPAASRPAIAAPVFEAAGLPPLPEASAPPVMAISSNRELAAAASSPRWNWRHGLVVVWVTGALMAVAREAIRYLRFVRAAPLGEPADAEDDAAWRQLLALRGVRYPIPLRMTARLGPVLCRLPGGYRLLAPREAWRALSSEARLALLRHELAHYERRDVWKSLAVRMLVLPHWFNPLAWRAVRHFDEAAEWACDAAACKTSPETAPAYGKALLSLAVGRAPQAILNTAAQGCGLALRIERILAPTLPEDSTMKKTLWISIAAVILLAGGLEFKLVARGEEDRADRASSPAHDAAVQAMLEASKKTWEVTAMEFDNGRVTLSDVYVWSRRLLETERLASKDKDGEYDALLQHWRRMRVLHNKIQALFDVAARGGEAQKLHATSFYVAEAELWLVDAGGQAPGDED